MSRAALMQQQQQQASPSASSSGHARQMSGVSAVSDSDTINPAVPLFQAVTGHIPAHDGELTLAAGDIVTSVRQLGNGWALGRNVSATDRPVGIFPATCVVPVTAELRNRTAPSRPGAAGSAGGECRRCGGSLPPSARTPNNELDGRARAPSGGHWEHDVDRHAVEIPLHQGDDVPLPQSPAVDRPRVLPSAAGTPDAAVAQHGDDDAADDGRAPAFLADSPPLSMPRRTAPLPPKPQLAVKPTRDNTVDDPRRTPSRRPVWADTADIAGGVGGLSPSRSAARARRDAAVDDDEADWCAWRSAPTAGGHEQLQQQRRQRGPPPPPPARSLSTFVGRSDPTLRQTVVTSGEMTSTSGSHCDCPLGVGRRHSALHHVRYHSAVDGARYVMSTPVNGSCPSAPDLSFGLTPPPGAILRPGRPILKSRTPRVADAAGIRRGGFRHPLATAHSARLSPWAVLYRLTGAIVAGLLIGVLVFTLLYFDHSVRVEISAAVAAFVALLVAAWLCVSRLGRCVVALVPVSLSTARGRVALCLVAASALLAGPVLNVHHNAAEAVHSLTCSAALALNRTASLLRPFDVMMGHLDRTASRLEVAAVDVALGLRPLDEGLDAVEMDVDNARTQLLGTRRTCKNLIDRAFAACDSGILNAQSQCLGVMSELGDVYHHARDVLDRINPERWASRTAQLATPPAGTGPLQPPPSPPLRRKRQAQQTDVLPNNSGGGLTDAGEDGAGLGVLPADSSNICEPLSVSRVCRALNDSEMLCQPSRWAGEAIQEAINATRTAMTALENALRFRIRSAPYESARASANATKLSAGDGFAEFDDSTSCFPVVVLVVRCLIPFVVALILLRDAYIYVRLYLCGCDSYDNVYIDSSFVELDRRRAEVTGDRLLPLKKHERRHLVTATSACLSRCEYRLCRYGLCVLALSVSVAAVVCTFDYALYWVLAAVDDPALGRLELERSAGRQRRDASKSPDVHGVVVGDGVLVSLLDVLVRGFRPVLIKPADVDEKARSIECLPTARPPSALVMVLLAVVYALFLLAVVLKAYVYRLRVRLAACFYPERASERVVHLYSMMLRRRRRLPCLLRQLALAGRRRRMARDGGCCAAALRRSWLATLLLPRAWVGPRCAVCECANGARFRECPCGAAYCAECFVDVGRSCPLCRHDDTTAAGGCTHATVAADDDDDDNDDENCSVDDALEAYSASNRVF